MSSLPIDATVTFLYTDDLAKSAQFYEQVLGLGLWLDQGSCRIYRVSGNNYLGICQSSDTMQAGATTGVIFTLVTQQVDEWYEQLQQQGVTFEKAPVWNDKFKIYHCLLRDPNGYLIEIQRFGESP